MADVPIPRRVPARTRVKENSPVRHIDLPLVAAAIGLSVVGLLMIYSSTHRSAAEFGSSPSLYLKKQIIFLVLGIIGMVVATVVDYGLAQAYAPIFYLGSVFLLLLVRTPIGSSALGAQRWFQVAGFQFSPSLFSRLAVAGMLAAVLADMKGEISLRDVWRVVSLAAIPMFLVFIQPDIGTTIILATIMVAQLVVAGTRVRYLVVLALTALVAIVGAFQLHIIKQYQIERLTGFLDSTQTSATASYNLQQSEIAIGAGGITGTGYLKGSQTNLDFVPEQHTDFIFTVVGEELGFVGAALLMVLFAVLLWRTYRIAAQARDPFGTYLASGIAAMFAIQMFVNVGMTMGIMPITGIPLPFVSYGGSALIADFIAIGLLLNIRARRFV
jgi:rod shape determining protein RodA